MPTQVRPLSPLNRIPTEDLSKAWKQSMKAAKKAEFLPIRRVKLLEKTCREDNYLVAVHDGIQSVCDGDDGAITELTSDSGLRIQ